MLLQTPIAIALGWVISRSSPKIRWLIETLVLIPLVLTPLIIGYFLLKILQPNAMLGNALQTMGLSLVFDWKGAALAAAVVSLPLYVQAAVYAFSKVNHRLEFLSWSLGYGYVSTFWKISLPLAWRGIAGGALLALARNFGEFGATSIVMGSQIGNETVPLALYRTIHSPDSADELIGLLLASVCFSFLCLVLMRWLFQPHTLK